MQSEIFLNGKKYLSTKKATKIIELDEEHIKDLCREEKIDFTKVEGEYFVDLEKLFEYKNKTNKPMILPIRALSTAVLAVLLIGAGYFSGDILKQLNKTGEVVFSAVKNTKEITYKVGAEKRDLFKTQILDSNDNSPIKEIKDSKNVKTVDTYTQDFLDYLDGLRNRIVSVTADSLQLIADSVDETDLSVFANEVKQSTFVSSSLHKSINNLALAVYETASPVEQFAIVWYRTISGFFSSAEKTVDSQKSIVDSTDEGDSSVFASDNEAVQEEDEANSQQLTANSTNQNTTVVTNPIREIIKETVVERAIQTSGITLEDLQKLNNELRSEIYKLSSNTNAQITNTYQVISATNNNDNLGSVTITDSNISSSNVSGTELSFTNGTIQNLTVTGTATSTYGGPISATSGTYSGNLTVTGNTTLNTLTVSGDTIFDTDTLTIDSTNNRIGIGTSSPSDTLSINGATYLAPISAPAVTTDRLYNISNDLYWGGSLVAGSAVGNWTSNGTDVWRASGNVGIGTSSPSSDYRLSVQGNTYIKGNLRVNGNTTISDSGELTVGDKVISEGEIGVGTSSPYAKLAIQGTNVSTTTFGIYGFANQTQSLFDVYDNPTNNLNVFRITNDGNIGIATSSPFRKLSVEGSAWISGDLTANSFTATSSMSAPYFTAPDSSATSTFAGGFAVGTNKFVVDYSTGNVGIGTTSPSYKLDVDGSFRSGSLKINGSTLSNTTDSTTYLSGGTTSGIGANLTLFGSSHSTTPNVARFRVGATEMLRIDATGNVGIGTTSPFAKLSVTGTGTGTGSAFQVADSANSPKFTVLDNGNVGVGTVSPSTLLDITGTVSSPIKITRTAAANANIQYVNSNGTMFAGLNPSAGWAVGPNANLADSPFLTVLKTSGNVGIGTTSPFAKLSVTGAGTGTGLAFQVADSANSPKFTVFDNGNVGIGTVSPEAKLEVFGDMIIGDVTNGSVFRYNPTTNTIVNGAHENSIGVGSSNSIIAAGGATASSNINSIGTDSYVTTISGGYDNTIGNDSPAATISGGAHHRIDTGGTHGTIGGGSTNTIQAGGDYGFIGAGLSNIVGGTYAFIGAGSNNVATGFRSAVMGGYSNDATGQYATIPGGWGNAASGDYSFAFGYRANAAAAGVVVFKDSVNAQYTVNTTNMFGANFAGGYQLLGGNVGIGTTSPFAKLSVVGDVVADYFNATSTTATSTFAGGFAVGTNKLVVDR